MRFLKKIVLVFISALFFTNLYAIPGIDDYIPSESGQFVYYRDYTFSYEAYIGFLKYDNTTYSIRYYAPEPKKGCSSIELLITLNPEKNAAELSGEKILGNISNEDTDVLNYMHDMLYELSKRRKAMNRTSFAQPQKNSENFPQFGGTITIEYDFITPIFNISSISNKKETLLKAVFIGKIENSDDKTFTEFCGLPLYKAPLENVYEDNHIDLDARWTKALDNFFLMGDDAIMFTTELPVKQNYETTPYSFEEVLLQRFSLSTKANTILNNYQKMYKIKDFYILQNLCFSPVSNDYKQDIKIIKHNGENLYSITGITVYDSYYKKHQSYFEKLIQKVCKQL